MQDIQLELFDVEDNKVTLEELFQAYIDCRKHKRKTTNALDFEADFEQNLIELYHEINDGSYCSGKSIAFIVDKPVKREVFAADFRDRVVHHLIINKLLPLLEKEFIHDSYSCREGKGVQYGVKRVADFVRLCSENYSEDCYILKMDIQSFFMSIDKKLLFAKLKKFINQKYQAADKKLLIDLVQKVVCACPEKNCCIKGSRTNWNGLPPSKSLFTVAAQKGLPIGNLTSQVFANFYLTAFDKFVKNMCGVEFYGRYVDDFVIVHKSKEFLLRLIPRLKAFIRQELLLNLHPKKIYLQHYSKGVKFIGAVIKPGRQYIGNRTKGNFFDKLRFFNNEALHNENFVCENAEHFAACVNSYLGFMVHYSSFKIRRRMLCENIAPAWFKVINISKDFKKIVVKPEYKLRSMVMTKLKKRAKNCCRQRRKLDKKALAMGISIKTL